MSSDARLIVYPNAQKIFLDQMSGAMTFGELKRRCIELTKTIGLRNATFFIEYKAKYSLMYKIKLEGISGFIRRRVVSLECEQIYLNPEWSFEDRIRSYDRVITDVASQIRVLNLPLYQGVDVTVMHNGPGTQEDSRKSKDSFFGS